MPLEIGGVRRRVKFNNRTARLTRHAVEAVERRVLLAVDIPGTAGNDTITIVGTPSATTVTVNGTPHVVSVVPNQTINVNAGDGNDTINVESMTLPVTVNGAGGNDAITLSTLDMNLDDIEQQLTFTGGAGTDTAVLNDRTNGFDDTFDVFVDLIFRGFFGGFAYSDETESITLNTGLAAGATPSSGSPARGDGGASERGGGNNTINIEGLPAPTTLILNTGSGDDEILLAPVGMLLDPIEGPVVVNGETGNDTLRLSDQNNAFPDVWDITAALVTRPSFGGVTYATIESLEISAGLFSATLPGEGAEGGGDNGFNIASLSVPTTLNGGLGNDDFFVGSTGSLAPLAGIPLTLNGQSGIDRAVLNDTSNTADDSYTIRTNSALRNDAPLFTFGTIERLRADIGAGNNAVNVNSVAENVAVTIFAGAGDDAVRVGTGNLDAVDGRVTVDGEGGNDSILLDDQSPAAARDYVVTDRVVDVTGLLTSLLTYLGVEALTLRATGGSNLVTVEETPPATPLTLISNAGDDQVIVNDDATGLAEVIFTGAEDLAALTVRAGGRARIAPGGSNVLRTRALDVTGTGTLDITDNAAIIDYTGATSPLLAVRALAHSGYNNGAWTGPGIISSSAATTPGYAVGYGEATAVFTSFPATFAGQSVDSTTVLLRYTRAGDANLDRTVSLIDFNRLAGNFGATGNVLWTQGNFNFDNVINLQDFNRLAGNFGLSA